MQNDVGMEGTILFSLLGDLFEIFHCKEFKNQQHSSKVRGIIISGIILKLKKLELSEGAWLAPVTKFV